MSVTRDTLDARILASSLIDLFASVEALRRWFARFDAELLMELSETSSLEQCAQEVVELLARRGRVAELLRTLQDGVARGELTPRDRPGWLSTTRGASLVTEPAVEVFLNVWFPAFEPREPRLVVGRPVQMCVDLGPRRPGSGPQARPLGADVLTQLREVSRVDVWVQCPDADVTPCEGTLDLRTPGSALGFVLTPRCAGGLRVVVVLLLRNQPIHRVERELQVWDADTGAMRW